MTKLNFRGYMKGGRLALNSEMQYKRALEGFNDGDKLVLTITPEKQHRSLSQNAYYFLYLNVISEETGDDVNSLHEWAKRKFLPPQFITVNKEEIKIPASTTKLSKPDFSEYIERISATVGIAPPDPELAGFTSNKGIRKW